jgi:PTS system mannose-specific IIA component
MGTDATRRDDAGPPVGVVVVGHGRFAAEMVDTLLSVVGDIDGIEGVACRPDAAPETIGVAITEAVERVDRGAGAIVFTDMLGDTATNVSLRVADEHPGVEVVAGVNMPMLLKLTTSRWGTTAKDLADFIRRYGQEHIRWPTRVRAGNGAKS